VFVIIAIVFIAILAPLIVPFDPSIQDLDVRLKPPLTKINGRIHLFGTDQLGRDLLSRTIYGARISLVVGLSSAALSGAVGVFLGLIAGYFRGKLDVVLMRIVDVQMAFPYILIALSIVSIMGPSVRNVIVVFGITSWVTYARIVRGVTLPLREQEFISASRVLGASDMRILFHHILPNVLNHVIVIGSFELARIITSEAALSFLGMGIPPAIPTWGGMISDGREYVQSAWWIATFPGLTLALLVVAINLLGDMLRDALDPRTKL